MWYMTQWMKQTNYETNETNYVIMNVSDILHVPWKRLWKDQRKERQSRLIPPEYLKVKTEDKPFCQ